MSIETHAEPTAIDPADLIAAELVPEDPEYKPLFNESQWKWQLRNRHNNGLDHAIVKIGKRLFLHRLRFREHLGNQASH